MSLQVWLPLNGNYKNQGLNGNIVPEVMGSGITFTSGKIGEAATFPNNCNSCIHMPGLQLQIFSWTCWLKCTGEGAAAYQFLLSEGRDTGSMGVNIRLTKAGTGLYCDAHKVRSNTFTIELNKWYHFAMVADGTNMKYYLNGELKQTQAYTEDSDYAQSNNAFVLGKMAYSYTNTGAYFCFNGQLNDIRIYDHALSKKEVEEISKGLVLHYKLDNNGLGNPNLLKESSFIHKLIQGHASDYSHPLVIYNGGTSNHTFEISDNGIIQDTILLNSVSNLGIGFERLASDIDLDTSSYYTLSCEAKCSQPNSSLSIGLSYYKTDDSAVWRGGSNKKAFNDINTWQKFTLTFKPDADTKAIGYCFTVVGVSSGTDTWSIRACKMEKGSVATPWSPNPADLELDTSIIYDSSGYQNNGEIINNISIISNTPRYSVATHMSATNQKIKISNFPTSGFGNSYTFAWWEKISSVTPMHWGFADGIRVNGMYTGRLWNTGDSSNNPLYIPGTTTQVTAPSVNVWHHWVMTGDGTTCKVYQDGVLWGQAKTYKAISGSTIYINGWDSGTSYCSDNASMSDFRIYATALTAEQIKELYDTSVTIDKDGNVYAREVQEI